VGFLLTEDVEHPFDLSLGDDLPEPNFLGILDRDHQGEIPMSKAQLEVCSAFSEYFPFHKVFDYGRSVVRIDNLVTFG